MDSAPGLLLSFLNEGKRVYLHLLLREADSSGAIGTTVGATAIRLSEATYR